MLIRWLVGPGEESNDAPGAALRPGTMEFAKEVQNQRNLEMQSELRDYLLSESTTQPGGGSEPAGSGASLDREDDSGDPALDEVSLEALERLKAATRTLNDASFRGEVLPLVLRFVADSFDRVAIFMVRDDHVNGMAQVGIEERGGPDDMEMRAISFEKSESSWFTRAIDSRHPVRGPAVDDGDRKLLALFGGQNVDEAYVAPILSANHVVAVVYADGPQAGASSWADIGAIEVVLHHAGLALDRAALERALAQIEGEG